MLQRGKPFTHWMEKHPYEIFVLYAGKYDYYGLTREKFYQVVKRIPKKDLNDFDNALSEYGAINPNDSVDEIVDFFQKEIKEIQKLPLHDPADNSIYWDTEDELALENVEEEEEEEAKEDDSPKSFSYKPSIQSSFKLSFQPRVMHAENEEED